MTRRLLLAAYLCLAAACAARRSPVHPVLAETAESSDALAVSDSLEALIDARQDTAADRTYAWEVVRRREDDTAAYTFARAAVTGRLVQLRGLQAARLVPDVERFARRSRELDPGFRDGAATRLLGTLYVLAPGALLTNGDSERGLRLLETLAADRPDVVQNHLRLAEAYVTLGDPGPASPHLCRCLAADGKLRPDDRALLQQLVASAGTPRCEEAAMVVTARPRRRRPRVARARPHARRGPGETASTARPAAP
jgi:hypothetical protein